VNYEDTLLQAAEGVWLKCMGVTKGDAVLVVTDTELSDLGRHFVQAALTLGCDTVLAEMPPRSMHGQEPPAAVAAAMLEVDAALLVTSKSLSHTDARAKATERGVRMASMPMLTAEIVRGPLLSDYSVIKAETEDVAGRLTAAREVRISTPAGTELRLSLEGRQGLADTGVLTEAKAFGNLPAGEGYIAPMEGVGDGVLVVDGVMAGVGPVSTPIVMKVQDGTVTEITGGEEAESLRRMLDEAGENAYKIAEFGIGTNPLATLMGSPLVDEKVKGTVHVALGDNAHMGGTQSSNIHVDGILKNPTVELDGHVIMVDGKYVA
jgi:leucyl aminopeptidase (aminopeptidase T)